ncbi:MAG: HAMP domain-containing protein [Comamonadaceae bacterium]|nr:MAG: HAMP domain-containing protein [Comamonadaceae bacterium]
MTSGLQRRLLFMLLAPLGVLVLVSAWFDYQSADNAALQKDRQLVQYVPLLADSVLGPAFEPGGPPLILLAPPVEEFLNSSSDFVAYAINTPDGTLLHGAPWLAGTHPTTEEPEFRSEENDGVTWRIVSQRVHTSGGELVLVLADGSDPRQQWAVSVLYKVLLPNLVLILAAAFSVNWAVRRALRPLLELRDAVERRSPRDLSALDEEAPPEEVRPLVRSLNRLFGLVNAQAESQRRFVADAAHQLRTPLAGLQAQVEAWAQAANASANASPGGPAFTLRTEEINRLRNATRRTSQLANQLLALSRADMRAMDAQPLTRVDLRDLCANLLEIHFDAAESRRIDLGLEAEPAQVMGHEWLLRELLSNLIDNAIKYTPEGGTVTIRCGMRGAAPYMEVEDDGPGVAPAEQGRVLERFYRVQGSPGEGNGLGLAIASEIANMHRSQLELAPGSGGRGLRVGLVFRTD